jgi:3-oxo-5-alpha-steroid 4-dehydrogenase 1
MISHENFNLVCWIWILVGVITFPFLLKVTQPYGKHAKSGWGPMINNRLGWLVMELPALLVFAYFLSFSPDFKNQIVLVAASLWGLHYIHRAVIFPFRLKTKGKKMPVIIVFSAILFNTVNGYLNGYWLSHFAPVTGNNMFTNFRLIIGVLIFLTGFIINQYHDRLLINLRHGQNTGYQIPFGGLFKLISCPNYLGEIISWFGFFIVTLGLPAFSFLVWTMVNLLPRALDHHKWYREKFREYPADRKAVFPYLL